MVRSRNREVSVRPSLTLEQYERQAGCGRRRAGSNRGGAWVRPFLSAGCRTQGRTGLGCAGIAAPQPGQTGAILGGHVGREDVDPIHVDVQLRKFAVSLNPQAIPDGVLVVAPVATSLLPAKFSITLSPPPWG